MVIYLIAFDVCLPATHGSVKSEKSPWVQISNQNYQL